MYQGGVFPIRLWRGSGGGFLNWGGVSESIKEECCWSECKGSGGVVGGARRLVASCNLCVYSGRMVRVLVIKGKRIVAHSTGGRCIPSNTMTVSKVGVYHINRATRVHETFPSTSFVSTGNNIVVPTFVGARRRVCDTVTQNLGVGNCTPGNFLCVLSKL